MKPMCSSTGTRSEAESGGRSSDLQAGARTVAAPPGLKIDARGKSNDSASNRRDMSTATAASKASAVSGENASPYLANRRRAWAGHGPFRALEQFVGPGLHEPCDRCFEFPARRVAEVASRPSSLRVIMKWTRTIGPSAKNGMNETNLSAKRSRELLPDGRASRRIVTVPRHVDEDRRKALERIPSRQHPHAGSFVELENRQRKSQ